MSSHEVSPRASDQPSRSRPAGPSRAPILILVAALLVLGGLADRARREETPVRVAGPAVMPSAAPGDANSSTWYCAGATAIPGGLANGTVVLANTGSGPVQGTVTVFTSDGRTATAPVQVGPSSVTGTSLAQVAAGPFVGAVVDLDAGQVTAELAMSGPRNDDVVPCASAASDRWYFPDGSTARDAGLAISLFNPFPDDAIADLSFSTDQGRASPADLEGIVVPARSLVVKSIGDHVRRRESVSTEVGVRRGRVVAAQTQVRTQPGRAGLSVMLGAPSLGHEWYFPSGVASAGVVERYAVANPGAREAKVLVEVRLDEGSAEPFELSIPPRGRLDLVLNDEARIPKGMGHSTTVRALNGVDVVAARTVEASASGRSGRADTLGARRPARAWAFAAGGTSGGVDELIVVQNVGTEPATVSFTGLAGGRPLAIEGLQGLVIQPGRRQLVTVGDHVKQAQLPLVVRSSGPVVAERALYRSSAGDFSATMGIPLD